MKPQFFIVLIFAVSCNVSLEKKSEKKSSKSDELEYIFIHRKGRLDTIKREILNRSSNDTFNIIKYKTNWRKQTVEREYKFPAKPEFNSLTDYKFYDEKIIHFDNRDYKIVKYLEAGGGADAEMLYFYSPDFGILIFRSAWWGHYDRLTRTGNENTDRITFYLIEMIMNNDAKREFFVRWDRSGQN